MPIHLLCRLPREVQIIYLSETSNLIICAFSRILIATIRDMGACPCPRCLVNEDNLHLIGTSQDTSDRVTLVRKDDHAFCAKVALAHEAIYKRGYVVNSVIVDEILKPESLVPTTACF